MINFEAAAYVLCCVRVPSCARLAGGARGFGHRPCLGVCPRWLPLNFHCQWCLMELLTRSRHWARGFGLNVGMLGARGSLSVQHGSSIGSTLGGRRPRRLRQFAQLSKQRRHVHHLQAARGGRASAEAGFCSRLRSSTKTQRLHGEQLTSASVCLLLYVSAFPRFSFSFSFSSHLASPHNSFLTSCSFFCSVFVSVQDPHFILAVPPTPTGDGDIRAISEQCVCMLARLGAAETTCVGPFHVEYHHVRAMQVRLSNGEVLLFVESRIGSCGDQAPKDITMKRSIDSGRTWGPLTLVVGPVKHVPNELDFSARNPYVSVAANGNIILSWVRIPFIHGYGSAIDPALVAVTK
jgi:hypothetical protein